MERISVCIITLNEEKNIARCIHSVAGIADEVVVVDSGSADQTVAIAASLGARVIHHPFEGHIPQKNFALAQASHPWVLSLDADEALSETLRHSILSERETLQADGYTMNRLTSYCGNWIRHGAWYPDTKLRLVRRDRAAWTGVNPHDRLEMLKGSRIRKLKGDLLHYSFYTLNDHLAQIEKFTAISAEAMVKAGKKPGIWHLVCKPGIRFLRDYGFRLGFLDGWAGFQIARLSACAVFTKYAKARELWEQQGK